MVRTGIALLFVVVAVLGIGATPVAAQQLTFEERVAAQAAIERVYYSHQIGTRVPFEQAVPREALERRVRDFLRRADELESVRLHPITIDELQHERRRVELATRMPDRLDELYAALGHDSILIEECLIRPVAVERLLRSIDTDTSRLSDAPRGGCALDDSWTATSVIGAPSPRVRHTTVWTGSLMIVWGGGLDGSPFDTGGRYDATLNSWTPTSTLGAPQGRWGHTAVWTGDRMVVWGGLSDYTTRLGDGGSYDPLTDSWTSIPAGGGSPSPRDDHTAIWDGSGMLIWGGQVRAGSEFCDDDQTQTGARFDPSGGGSWTAITTTDAPFARGRHTAVWDGTEMIVWGGLRHSTLVPYICVNSFHPVGGRYDPDTDTWTLMSTSNAPVPRAGHTGVWTGAEMIVWAGFRSDIQGIFTTYNDGGRYDPVADSWLTITSANAPSAGDDLRGFLGFWSGTQMLAWGHMEGGRYQPSTDSWLDIATAGAPTDFGQGVWTGSRMIVWGGSSGDGGVYDPGSADGDGDCLPDTCDPWPGTADDADADGVGDGCDNCVVNFNPDQVDLDADGLGDPCDNCAIDANPEQEDGDGDGAGNVCDNCPTIFNAQIDSDGDGAGDACDPCPQDNPDDLDGDGICTSLDNCAARSNAAQRDTDVDGVGNLCDICPGDPDPNQDDADGDGAGDACDCLPDDPNTRPPDAVALLQVSRQGATADLSWSAAAGADAYSVTRGLLSAVDVNAYGDCLMDGVTGTDVQDGDIPAAGDGFGYILQGQNYDCGFGPLGYDSAEALRLNLSVGACAGQTVVDARALMETTEQGSISGSFIDTTASDDAYEAITEVLSSGGNPSNRFSVLDHRWTLNVTAGSLIQLHVEGFRTNLGDGDDFAFEYSTDGGSNFTPIALSSLPLADNDVHLFGALPSTLAGAVIVRVVDTNNDPGAQLLDTVSIDDLFIRSVN